MERAAPGEKSGSEKVCAQCSILTTMIYGLLLPLSDLGHLIFMLVEQGNKGWLFLTEEPPHMPLTEIHKARLKCGRQPKAETALSAVYAANSQ